ncbi:hypothetical protein FBEOM_11277 [Fusarium beomiforme]|uniref:Uncharacterized protein n=1 Tax=Fusarium beomiforme TaxID=44412 RepID=A0A9P5DRV9_9HYPO|nr:hypothetical protein FBEOM_11277 [Fusarium beomiforme]
MTSTPVQMESGASTPSVSISSNDCQVHGLSDSDTPHLDKLLQSRPKAELQDLADAIDSLKHGDQCAKCAVQAAVTIITGFLQELYTAKKNGKMSKEDKKALKSEVKGLVKGMKGDVKMRKKEIKGQ